MLPFLIAGIVTGSVYGLAGAGLILTYKTSGIFNFAHGALATVAAFLFYQLSVLNGLPPLVAGVVCVGVVAPLLALGFERVARALADASLVMRTLATVGILLIVQSVIVIVYGETETRTVPQYFPDHAVEIAGTPVKVSDLIVAAIGLCATTALYVFFKTTRTGVAMKAVVNDSELLGLAGTNPVRIRRYAWMIGVCFATLSGILIAPMIRLDATVLTLLVAQAFGAAAIGRFASLPMTYLGGLAIGVVSSLATKYFSSGLLAGLPAALPFVTLFVVLLVSRRERLADKASASPSASGAWRAPWQLQAVFGVVLFAALYLVPDLVGYYVNDWTLFLATSIVFLSLGLLVRTSGQVSLAQVGFMAVGAAAFSHFAVDFGLPWVVALLLAGAVAVPIGALLAIPAIRLSGLYLALATLGFGIVLAYMFYTEPYLFGSSGLGLEEPRPGADFLATDAGFYRLVLVLAALCTLVVVWLNRSRLGRLLQALSDSPRGLATVGTSVNVTRVLVFCLSAFLAAIGGALAGAAQGVVTADSYAPLLSLTYFAVVVIQPGREPWYALLGAGGLTLIPAYFPSTNTSYWLELLFGVFAVGYALMPADRRGGVPGAISRRVDRLVPRRSRSGDRVPPREPENVVPAQLRVDDVRVRFGGVVAVDGLSLSVPTGRITGLIGPNGAGKTTTFDVISGLNRSFDGQVTLDGHRLSAMGPAARARMGLGRTFQKMELFDSASVLRNVELGFEGSRAGRNPLTHLAATRSARREASAVAEAVLRTCGISHLRDHPVSALSTGQRRLVELARCLAGPHRLLLLDEPSSGLDREETRRFGEVLRAAVEQRGIGILLVEHDMALVQMVCEYVYVLDFGRLIFEGSAAEVMGSPIVRAAYLGDDVSSDEPDSTFVTKG
ncbi:branched-chain amino acid ABC transporter permease/ATP-binding protein [Amycolatopsis jejuensis]|uniref:branched-chain amino acid ABC transporter permease/ATP-binding protein n=1 Tax=Amycolatopsis jejuensis TaxID=330084 RepID=UPI00052688BB|nr:branched-chain amino acid ABC transporter permease/ATP-binding protein [Amycolatopsis jejuensis]